MHRKIHILVLGDVHEGGEWISTMRLMHAATQASNRNVFFSLIGFAKAFKPKLNYVMYSEFISHSQITGRFNFIKNVLYDFLATRQVIKKFKDKHQDIEIYWATDFLMTLAAFSLNFRKRRTLVFHFHGLRSAIIKNFSDINYRQIVLKILERLALLLCDFIAVPSDNVKSYVQSMLGLLGKWKQLHVVPNSVAPEFFKKFSVADLIQFRRNLGVNRSVKIILYSGRITKYKGLENLIDGFFYFNNIFLKSVLIIAYPTSNMEKSLLQALKEKISQFNYDKNIKLVSDLSQTDLIKLYRTSDVLILPSELEMAPVVIIEALATGTPCIGTNVGNISKILSLQDRSLVLATNNSREIASKLTAFFHFSPQRLQKIKKKGMRLARTHSASRVANEFLRLVISVET